MTTPDTTAEAPAGRRRTVAGRIVGFILGPSNAWYFSIPAVVLLLLVGATAVFLFTAERSAQLQADALTEAKRDAEWEASMIAAGLSPEQLSSPANGTAYRDLQEKIAPHMTHPSVLRVKLWSPSGEIIYSDDKSLVGTSEPLTGELAEAMGGKTAAEVEDMDSVSHAAERPFGRAFETFVPIRLGDSSEVVGVLEVYRDYAPVAAAIKESRDAAYLVAGAGFTLVLAVMLLIHRWGVSIIGRRTDQLALRERELVTEIEQRKLVETNLLESQQVLQDINVAVTDGILVVSRDLDILWANEAASVRYGGASVIGKTCHEASHLRSSPCEPPLDPCPIRELLETGKPATVTHMHPNAQGAPTPVEVTAYPVRDENGEITKFVHVARDVAERARAENAIRESETKFRMLTDTVAAAAFIFQGERIRYANRGAAVVTGYTQDELLAQNFWDVIHPDFRELVKSNGLARQRGEPVPPRYEVKILTKQGEEKWVDFQAGGIEFDGAPAALGTAFDITDRKQAEEQIKHMAFHDSLTGLPNRALIIDRIDKAIAQARRSDEAAAVLFLDVDGFKAVNDTLGHAIGDQFLQSVAARLVAIVRESDSVGRTGGDEFVIALSAMSAADESIEVATRIVTAFRSPWEVAGQDFHLTASIGIAVFPGDGDDADTLLRNADTAMYRAKEEGRDQFQVFAPAMSAYVSARVALESELRRALDREEFVVHYQPQIQVATREMIGMEALVRWQHADRGLVHPDTFIPLAEATGLIVPLGEWVLRTACAQNVAYQQAGLPPVRVAVNLSARQFQQPDLADMVSAVLQETGLDPMWLDLEITENTAMRDIESAIATLLRLREMGVQISIDDFGTGHSSLAYLGRLPIDALKIAPSFVQDVVKRPDDAVIVAASVGLGNSLRLRVIAEGVETEEQFEFLRSKGCTEVQGYLFGRPMPASALADLLSGGPPSASVPSSTNGDIARPVPTDIS